jgi:hypothetical protein
MAVRVHRAGRAQETGGFVAINPSLPQLSIVSLSRCRAICATEKSEH